MYDPADNELFTDAICMAEEDVCFEKETDFGPVSLAYELNSANGVIKEIIRLKGEEHEGIEMFTQIDFMGRE